jgi:hypothetical protein
MAVFKNGIFAYDNGKPVTPQSLGISLAGIQTCQQFFTSGSISDNAQRYAVYSLVADLENYGIWDKMKAIYPMVGQSGVSSSFQLNLKDPSTFKGTFSGGWTFASTGITGNGSNAYMNTLFNPNNDLPSLFSSHLSIYSRTQVRNGIDIGSATIGTEFALSADLNISSYYAYASIGDKSANNLSSNSSTGFFLANRQSQTSVKAIQNSTLLATNNGSSTSTKPNFNVYIGGMNNGGALTNSSTRQIAFASIGDSLTDTEAANFYTAVQRFQTTLGRQV